MGKSLLSVNAGSSSVKVTFYTMTKPPKVIANAQVSGITAPPQNFKYQCGGDKKKQDIEEKLSTPQDAFKYLLDQCFKNPQLSEVASSEDLAYILHRIVH
jgi:acetate kinase